MLLWVACVASISIGGVLVACGGSESGVSDGTGGGGEDATVPGDDGSTTNPPPPPPNPPPPPPGDGGTDGTTGGGDASFRPSNPNKVTCGTTECSTPSQVCCVGGLGSDGGSTCRDAGGPNQCPIGASVIECDERADCEAGICCIEFNVGSVTLDCRNQCNQGRLQACKTSAECTTGDAGCQLYHCGRDGGGFYVQTCTKPQFCN